MDTFDLPCRLVEFFDEDQAVAMWVEDGTEFPLYTCSNIQPYDSQVTQDISSDCTRICVRSSKKLLATLKLERHMLLYLREVKLTFQYSEVDIALFEVQGAVELLPLNTRYHKSLLQRLEKSQIARNEIQPSEHILEDPLHIDHPTVVPPLAEQLTKEQSTNVQPSKEQTIEDQPTEEQRSNEQPVNKQQAKEQSANQRSGRKKPLKDKHIEDLEPQQSCRIRVEIELDKSPRQVTKDPTPQIVVETSTEEAEVKIDSQKGNLYQLCLLLK